MDRTTALAWFVGLLIGATILSSILTAEKRWKLAALTWVILIGAWAVGYYIADN
jgi:hypothetical protein